MDKIKSDCKTIDEIHESQKFISAQYEEIGKKQITIESDISEIKGKVEKQENKTEHMFTYSRMDHVIFNGVPFCPVARLQVCAQNLRLCLTQQVKMNA